MGKKCILDKFYTKPEIVKELLNYIDLEKYDAVIEPSAGNGSFSNNIYHENLIALDIEPESSNIKKQNWFDYNISKKFKNVLIIGNPPFGDRNNLSKEFIKHSLTFSNITTIAFVLPNVFKKHTNQKIIPENFRLAKIIDLPKDSFLFKNENYHVPCSFFIWTKEAGINDFSFDVEKYKKHPDFDFVTKENADFYILGASPSTIKKINDVSSTNRGYYIKSNIPIEQLIRNFKHIQWGKIGNSSVNGGVSWYSKPELIKFYEDNKKL